MGFEETSERGYFYTRMYFAWYDNEMGYVGSLLEHVKKAGSYLH